MRTYDQLKEAIELPAWLDEAAYNSIISKLDSGNHPTGAAAKLVFELSGGTSKLEQVHTLMKAITYSKYPKAVAVLKRQLHNRNGVKKQLETMIEKGKSVTTTEDDWNSAVEIWKKEIIDDNTEIQELTEVIAILERIV